MDQEKKKARAIVVIDVDRTLIDRDPNNSWMGDSWFLLTSAFKANIEIHKEIYKEFLGSISGNEEADKWFHDQMAEELVMQWREAYGQPITRKDIRAISEIITRRVSEEARAAITELIENGIFVIIGTGGIADAAEAIANTLQIQEATLSEIESPDNIDWWFGNTKFEYDEGDTPTDDDVLIGFEHTKNIAGHKKIQAVKKMEEIEQKIGSYDHLPVIAVGDGVSDSALFTKSSVYGIAFQPTNLDLRAEADVVVETWQEVVSAALSYVARQEAEAESFS
jgi:phosphoserine phosphatase